MKIIIFENDSDFEFFAVDPRVNIKTMNDRSYYDWDFTAEYNSEVSNDTLFFIKDPDSKIAKRHVVVSGIISKPVKNVFYYNDLIAESDNPDIEIENYSEKHNK